MKRQRRVFLKCVGLPRLSRGFGRAAAEIRAPLAAPAFTEDAGTESIR